jgi:hypothetical protein
MFLSLCLQLRSGEQLQLQSGLCLRCGVQHEHLYLQSLHGVLNAYVHLSAGMYDVFVPEHGVFVPDDNLYLHPGNLPLSELGRDERSLAKLNAETFLQCQRSKGNETKAR